MDLDERQKKSGILKVIGIYECGQFQANLNKNLDYSSGYDILFDTELGLN